jgi:chaperonin GroES
LAGGVGGVSLLAWAAMVRRWEDATAAARILGGMRQELRPLFDRVVIKELEPDRVRQSGLVVPPGSHEPPPQHGIVLAVGPGIDWWESAGVSMPVKPGDHVVFPASAGVWVEVEEEKLLVCRVGELLGVLETAAERSQAGHGASETGS